MSRHAIRAFVFLGAALLFALEPMLGRLLLPRFGGAVHVWTTALMFFQGALFVAYLYAHLLTARVGRGHLAVVALPILLLPLSLGDAPPPAGVPGVLELLTLRAGPLVLALATTSVVAQRWWERHEPWGLYAISNAGSLGALLAYSLLIEPLVGLETQRWVWSGAYVLYALLASLAWYTRPIAIPLAAPSARPKIALDRGELGRLAYWLALSAGTSALLMAVTNLIALDAGSGPLVWSLPLAIYLATFVLAFAPRADGRTRAPAAVRRLWPHVAAVGLFFFFGAGSDGPLDALVQLAVLAVVCLAAHDELFRVRPPAAQLTLYYLAIAAGGWLGGALVALLAPSLFDGLWEYPIALGVLALAIGLVKRSELLRLVRRPGLPLAASVALAAAIVVKIAIGGGERGTETLAVRRSFYGLYRVTRTVEPTFAVRDLVSGRTRHGRQREGDPAPLSYYHARGPLGDALAVVPAPRRVGAVGLGVGATATHLGEGERVRFFEIDPVVAEIARTQFSFLSRSRARVEIVIGDARLSLAREERDGAEPYDLLLVDAFAGDAIPAHLLTREALELDRRRTSPQGILLLHVSNRYYDLVPILARAARDLRLHGAFVHRLRDLAPDQDPSSYVALAAAREPIDSLVAARGWRRLEDVAPGALWTDDHANVLSALR